MINSESPLFVAIKSLNKSTQEALRTVNQLLEAQNAIIKAFEAEASIAGEMQVDGLAPSAATTLKTHLPATEERALNKFLKPNEIKILDQADKHLIKKFNIYSHRQKVLLKQFVDKPHMSILLSAESAHENGFKMHKSSANTILQEPIKDGVLINQTPDKKKFRTFRLAPAINEYLKRGVAG